jgi:hypothetical protein
MIGWNDDDMCSNPHVIAYCKTAMSIENGVIVERYVATDPNVATISLNDRTS